MEPPIRDFFSLDHEHHWALIYNQDKKEFLFRTDDGGTHWSSSPLPFQIWRVFFADTSEGWGIAANKVGESVHTFCIHTSDAGLTWQRLGPIAHDWGVPAGIAFDSSLHGWVVGEGHEEGASGLAFVMETNDGGMHWTKQSWKTIPASGLYGVRLYNGRALAWSGGSGASGIFELLPGATPKKIFDRETMDFAYFPGGTLVAISGSAFYLRTADSADWDETLQPSESVFRSLAFVDSQRGCVAGNTMYCTQDGGQTWTHRPLPKTKMAHRGDPLYVLLLCLVGGDTVWAVSEDAVYATTWSSRTWTKVNFFDKSGKPMESLTSVPPS